MEVATEKKKNKKGRPRSAARHALERAERVYPDVSGNSLRSKINSVYSGVALCNLSGPEKDFFYRGTKVIRQGILEQIGRLYDVDLITEGEIPEIARYCIEQYEKGFSVKEIEQYLRSKRIKWGK